MIFSHPSTNQARPCLASEIRRDQARSGWYGRRLNDILKKPEPTFHPLVSTCCLAGQPLAASCSQGQRSQPACLCAMGSGSCSPAPSLPVSSGPGPLGEPTSHQHLRSFSSFISCLSNHPDKEAQMHNCSFGAAELGLRLSSASDMHSVHISFCGSIDKCSCGFSSLILFLRATTLVRMAVPSAELRTLLLSPPRPWLQGPLSSEGLLAALLPVMCSFIFTALISASEYLVQVLMACLFAAMIPENTAGAL